MQRLGQGGELLGSERLGPCVRSATDRCESATARLARHRPRERKRVGKRLAAVGERGGDDLLHASVAGRKLNAPEGDEGGVDVRATAGRPFAKPRGIRCARRRAGRARRPRRRPSFRARRRTGRRPPAAPSRTRAGRSGAHRGSRRRAASRRCTGGSRRAWSRFGEARAGARPRRRRRRCRRDRRAPARARDRSRPRGRGGRVRRGSA